MTEPSAKKKTEAVGDIFYGDFVQNYEDKRAAKPAWNLEHAGFLKMLDRLPKGLRVLDLPFGTGRFLPEYVKREMIVTGSDISADIIDEGRAIRPEMMKNCSIYLGPSVPIPYSDDSFDLAVSFRFLSGIVDAGTAMETMREFQRIAPRAILQLKCRPADLPPGQPPLPNEKLSKNYYREQMDEFFAGLGWKVDADYQVDEDPTGNRWIFLVSRL